MRLPPPEAFPDDYAPPSALLEYRPGADPAETGPRSRTIRIVIHRRCCGWRTRPTPQEVYDAMRADEPTPRQVEVMTVVLNSATFDEMLLAHLEGAFTWRQVGCPRRASRTSSSRWTTPRASSRAACYGTQ